MIRRATVLVLTATFATACSSTAGALCSRLDECNNLAAGVSVEQCSENFTVALDALTPSARLDCEVQIDDALSRATCEAFVNEPLTSCTTFF